MRILPAFPGIDAVFGIGGLTRSKMLDASRPEE